MDRAIRWKVIFLFVLIALSVVYLVPSVVPSEQLPSWYAKVFHKRVKLGLDLQGGIHLVYRVDLAKAIDDKAGEQRRELEAKFTDLKVETTIETPRPNDAAGIPLGAIFITFKNPADKSKIDGKFMDDYAEVIAKIECPKDRAEAVCFRVTTDYAERIKISALEQAIKTIKDRVDRMGVNEPTIVRKGEDIVVELPGTDDEDNKRIRDIINRTAQLEFKIVEDGHQLSIGLFNHVGQDKDGNANEPTAKGLGIKTGRDAWANDVTGQNHQDWFLTATDVKQWVTPAQAAEYKCPVKGKPVVDGKIECLVTGRVVLEKYLKELPKNLQPGDEHQWAYEEQTPRKVALEDRSALKTWRSYLLRRTAELTGTAVLKAEVTWDQTTNRPEVSLEFTRHGGKRFGEVTSKNIGRRMAVILDEKITSAPTLQSAILDGRARITLGGGDNRSIQKEAEDLVNVLRTGALPAPLVESQKSEIGALLGQDAIDKAKLSMIVGAILVVLMMLYFYKISGLIANIAMVLNVLFQVAILAAFQATLTLPGIAGLVLTIGMAVDSNIIIYERIREELRSGKSVRGSIDAGFGRAFWTVFDAHVTNFVAGFVLLEYGTGPIRGFAVMLLIGIVVNLFTSTWVSRVMFDMWIGRKRAATATLSI